ncbi:hypothetical protein GCM10011591_45120 [Nocardia camponoti]|uniref:Uncharacterized protein n=1 Tax=Nocardia camponoti TaxID=1616106 RepID=A0A917QTS1_9NOCA|nr:hypothetical protein GCM10011591_45120 [Nocardia camponoti]
MHIALVQALWTPHELTAGRIDTEKVGVGLVILVSIRVPPPAIGPLTIGGTQLAARRAGGAKQRVSLGVTISGIRIRHGR